jgi:hypothetical protein
MKRDKKPGAENVTLVREVIACGSVTRLDRCGCGDLYLTVGPVTMALHPEALADLSATLGRALDSLARGVRPPEPTAHARAEPEAEAAGPARPPAREDMN